MTLLSQGTTNRILPSLEGRHNPNLLPVIFLSYVKCEPPTIHILFLTFGLSLSLILSAQVPVQFTTYLALMVYFFCVRVSLNTIPFICPDSSLMKS